MKKIALLVALAGFITAQPQSARADTATALKILAGTIGITYLIHTGYKSWQATCKAYQYCKEHPWVPIAGVISAGCVYHIGSELAKGALSNPLNFK